MLRPDVVEAVREQKFQVIPVATINEGIAVLTGSEAGQRGDDGEFPEGTVNGLVEATLRRYAETRRRFGLRAEGNKT